MREFKDLRIAVAGTGYVGLSIATLLSQHHKVTAVDVIPEKVEKIKQVANGKKIIFHAGRHVRHKGLEDLIEAEKLIKSDCVIYVGGDGPTTDEMMQEKI